MAIAGDTQRRVFFCFTCDPYPPTTSLTTRNALEICADYGIPFSVCTKGGWRAARDFKIMRDACGWFGTTLTCWEPEQSAKWEPLAAPPLSRCDAIKEAYRQRIFTWVSLEPVLEPRDALHWIRHLAGYVKLWRIGKWNHDARANKLDWASFAQDAYDAVRATGASYLIKQDLSKYLPAGTVTEYWAQAGTGGAH